MKKYNFKRYFFLFSYVFIFSISIVITTIVLHEMGHYYTGKTIGCRDIKIFLFDESNQATYTQMNCKDFSPILMLSGFFFIIPFAIYLAYLKYFPERHFSLIIIGFNFLISSLDIMVFTNIYLISLFLNLLGFIIIILGETLLIDKIIYLSRKGEKYDFGTTTSGL